MCFSGAAAVTIATVNTPQSMSAAGRVARPTAMSTPQTSSVLATNGAWTERTEVLNESAQLAKFTQARAEELQPDRGAHDQSGYPLRAIEPGVETSHEIAEVFHVRSLPLMTFEVRSLPRMSWSAVRSGGCLTSKRSRSSVAHETKRTGSRTSTAAVVRSPVRKLISPANCPAR